MKINEVLIDTDVSYSPAIRVQAGKLSALYEEGKIRYINYEDRELIRLIYAALRDENWTTVPGSISNEQISTGESSFRISYEAVYLSGDIHYRARYLIEGFDDSRLEFSMKGDALGSFRSNRIGLCVLHPAETCAGQEAVVESTDGSDSISAFPEMVAPWQPFKKVRTIWWAAGSGNEIKVEFSGDVFETEDQRNWGDHSFKTYSRPTELPAPYDVRPGDGMEQQVRVSLLEGRSTALVPAGEVPELKFAMPAIGYARGLQQSPLTEKEMTELKALIFDHYQVTLSLSDCHWKETFHAAAKEAQELQTRMLLSVRLNPGTEDQLNELLEVISPAADFIISVLILSEKNRTCPVEEWKNAQRLIKNTFPSMPVGFGTDGNFADLNRSEPGPIGFDFVSYHLQPQAHLSDSRTIMENLDSGPAVIQTAIGKWGGKPVHVSPITFSKKNTDPRMHTWFGAWWTIGAIARLAEAERLTFYELKGERGLLHEGEPTPVYKILKELKSFSPAYVLSHTGDDVIFENKSGERLVFRSGFQQYKKSIN